MSELEDMHRVIGQVAQTNSPLSAHDQEILLAGHRQASDHADDADLQVYLSALKGIAQTEFGRKSLAGDVVLSSLNSLRPLSTVEAGSDISIAAGNCQQLLVPHPTMQSSPEAVLNDAGSVMRFSRASASNRTLEVAAATGEIGGERWPSSEEFIFGLNRSRAYLAGFINVPAPSPVHPDNAILKVSARLRVEDVISNGRATRPGSSLLHVIQGHEDLPLRGTAIAWCDASLSIYGAAGSIRNRIRFVSSWVNDDGANQTDLAPRGEINLACTVALSSADTAVSYFVETACSAFAEESTRQFESAFSVFDCRNKPIPEIIGVYVLPAQLRLESVTASRCGVPPLTQRA